MAKIFISYKRNIDPDMSVVKAVFEALIIEHDVFIDTTIQVGEKWAERIQNEIHQSDYLIIFLSEHSVNSEMVIAEVETAHHHCKAHQKPVILPVRLRYAEPLVYPLSAYLNPLQWAIWESESDTKRLIGELQKVTSGGKLPAAGGGKQPTYFPGEDGIPTAFANILLDWGSPEGTMPHQSPFYVERNSDRETLRALCSGTGLTITIKGSRQMGKSSLLNRILAEGCGQKMHTAFVDFQMIEKAVIENAGIFYRQFCSLLSWEFGIEDQTDRYWEPPLGNVQKTTNYVQKHLLREMPGARVLLAMDEVERMFGSPIRSDFFSMLRSWHNRRALDPDWQRFNMALVTSTEPYQFIADLNQSPFNVGLVVELTDFTLNQVQDLNHRHHNPLSDIQAKELFTLLSGHPYLTRKALYLIASQRLTFMELVKNSCEDNGPFGDHLRNYLFRMSGQKSIKAGLLQVIKFHRCPNDHIFFQLRGAGLVKRAGNKDYPRNNLYAEYFGKRLNA